MTIELWNCDNMAYMYQCEDNAFELAIVDPEFGIGIANNPSRQRYDKKDWDNKVVDKKYFKQLFRVSQNQIIFGGNYFGLPPNKHCIIWDKKQPESFSFGMFDYAWTSFDKPNKIFRYSVLTERDKIHSCQKPVALYKWLLKNYAKQGDKIIDTHFGSLSIGIACHDLEFDLVACEKDKEYFEAGKARLEAHQKQLKLFSFAGL